MMQFALKINIIFNPNSEYPTCSFLYQILKSRREIRCQKASISLCKIHISA
ncbi:hypothetical protein J502_0665 [Acinetobacter sp. 1294596]|nr:hypothetical protein J502_0665 [Acinetobacter sp. 1294596]